MPRRPRAPRGRRTLLVPLALAAAGVAAGCGKRGDPLPPFRRNPEPVARLELAQRGGEYELAFVAPTRTIDGQQLPVLDVELLMSSEVGPLDELAEPVLLKAAPGERITHTGPLPEPGTPVRFAVRTRAAGKPSPLSPESLLVVAPPPPPPSDVSVRATPEGLSLTWTECVPTTPEPVVQEEEDPTGEEPASAEAAEGAAAGDAGAEDAVVGVAEGEDAVVGDEDAEGEATAAEEPASADAAGDTVAGVAQGEDAVVGDEGVEGEATAAEETPSDDAVPAADAEAGDAEPTATAPAAPQPAPSPGVRLYRRTPDGELLEPLVASPLATEAYLDTDVEHGQELCYQLRTQLRGAPRVEGEVSEEVCATFLDLLPPAPPAGLSALRLEEAVELAWSPLPDDAEVPDALHVYRAAGDGPLEKLAELAGEATRWSDPSAPDDVVLEYALTASDAHGNESAPSGRARLIPP